MLTSGTSPKGQCPREEFSSHTCTKSCTARFRLLCCHFDLTCKAGRYSLSQRRQKIFAKYWTCLHHHRSCQIHLEGNTYSSVTTTVYSARELAGHGDHHLPV
ncbi:hypothetical protein DPMN_168846 [Dreissena polymorpha]|uniref:Uncharacterized protein n=1 Tax=Dreissena polymorpha TaxID=45954 RepID=A0A9D4IWA8_DREPO|nr:hypothetical protein DPMN_168846 [Dreissena polymorpha]